MVNEKYIELMNKEIDGVISPIEQTDLYKYLNENLEAKKYYNELKQTGMLLNRLPNLNPSPELKKQILNSIDVNRYKAKQSNYYMKSFIQHVLIKPKYKVAFASGLVACFFIYLIFRNEYSNLSVENKDAFGTIGLNQNLVESVPVMLENIKGEISLRKKDNFIQIDAELELTQAGSLAIHFDPEIIKFKNISPDFLTRQISNEDGILKVSLFKPYKNIITFTQLKPSAVRFLVTIDQSGNTLFEHNFSLK